MQYNIETNVHRFCGKKKLLPSFSGQFLRFYEVIWGDMG